MISSWGKWIRSRIRLSNDNKTEKFELPLMVVLIWMYIFPEEDYDAFCLSYMFTYRDFEKGTLGLAWTGDLKNAGGVCEKNGVCYFILRMP